MTRNQHQIIILEMEGYLKMKYAGYFSGYKVYYTRLKKAKLVFGKAPQSRKDTIKFDLDKDNISFEGDAKDTLAIWLTSENKQKIALKFADSVEKQMWMEAINDNMNRHSDVSFSSDNNPVVAHYKENIYEAFQSQVFCDEQSMDGLLQAFNEVHSMFNQELDLLVLQTELTQTGVKPQINNIKNLSKTMGNLIKNVLEEIELSREQSFKLLESVAFLEYDKNPKKFKKSAQQKQKQKAPNVKRKKKSPAMSVESDDMSFSESPFSHDIRNFDEEYKTSDHQLNRSLSMSMGEGSDSDPEDEYFQDAQGEIILSDQITEKGSRVILDGISELRVTLPAIRPPSFKISMWSIIRDVAGQDLTRITFPVIINEPLSVTQRACETTEYLELCEQAANEPDPMRRLMLICLRSMSSYQTVIDRKYKPFNPLLGETFEMVTPLFRYHAEQVSHHPPVTAFHCEGRNFEFFNQQDHKMRFKSGSVYVPNMSKNYTILKLPEDEVYSDEIPNVVVRNLILGTMYTDFEGKVTIKNHTLGHYAQLEYKLRKWGGRGAFEVDGTLFDKDGVAQYKFEGLWNSKAEIKTLDTNKVVMDWKCRPKPEQSPNYFFFTEYSLQLNYLPEELKDKLPPTDVRLRPDIRALENGDMKLAAAEKHRLEENQRARRKQMESQEEHYKARYFENKVCPGTGDMMYQANGQYWIDRAAKDWSNLVRIYED